MAHDGKYAHQNDLPLILYAPLPPEGHMHPALQICRYLVDQSFDVTLLGVSRWEATVEAAGISFAPLMGMMKGGASEGIPKIPREVMTMPLAPILGSAFGKRFAKLMVCSWDALRFALAEMRHRVGLDALQTRGVVILADTGFEGTLPLKLGAYRPPGLEGVAIKTIGIGVVPRFWATPFHGPWGIGLPYDASEAGVERTLQAHAEQAALYRRDGGEDKARLVLDMYGCDAEVDSLFAGYETYTAAGGKKYDICHSLLDAITVCHGTTLQMGMESLEFPIPADAAGQQQLVPPHLKHAGFLPLKKVPADLVYPPWFHELVESQHANQDSSRRRNIILVAQGTTTVNYDELIIPTIQALANNDKMLVIAILCRHGAKLDPGSFEGATLPSNARVLDYFPYDALLPYVDVLVSSSGFGGLTHAVANAVPLVQAGWIVDKPDIGRRVEHSGLGVYLGRETHPADPVAIKAAVHLILANPDKYKQRALELRAESLAKYRPLEMIVDEIMALSRS